MCMSCCFFNPNPNIDCIFIIFTANYGALPEAPQNAGDDFSNEPPLLEELGINPDHILQKTLTILNPMRSTRSEVARDADLAGPLVFCLAFGWMLLLTGKIHFNYIYGIGAMGCVANYGLLTLMSTASVSFFGKFSLMFDEKLDFYETKLKLHTLILKLIK